MSFKGVGWFAPPSVIPGIFAAVQKYSTLGNLIRLNLNYVGSA